MEGTPSDVSHLGEFEGYRVIEGCAGKVDQPRWMGPGSQWVVLGGGQRWARGVAPCPRVGSCTYISDRISANGYHTDRTSVVTSLRGPLLRLTSHVDSVFAVRASTACAGHGLFAEVVLSSHRDVDEAAMAIGRGLHAAGVQERVGIRVEPRPCVIPPAHGGAHP